MPADTQLFIDGKWRAGRGGEKPILNPATEETIGSHAVAEKTDLDDALAAAGRGFEKWRRTSAFERSKLMRRAADLLRERNESIARAMTMEQGKPLAEARMEAAAAADVIDWFAEEGRRAYGRIVPGRATNVSQMVIKEPVGPVAAFSPWNFPINQAVRKISAALAAGCSIILKGPEDTPMSCAALVAAFADAGAPAGVVNLVFGDPATISAYLIPHSAIRKISFTGSTAVGKQLASLAGLHMKRVTMELGGHAPAIVFEDADLDRAVKVLSASKFRNAGQVCVAPTRFLVHESVYPTFVDGFVKAARSIKVGDGLGEGVTMGPVAHARRLDAMEAITADAVSHGAKVACGGERIGNRGYFFAPTVLTDVPLGARVMNEEPFGPIAVMSAFSKYDDAISEANRLPYGLAAYAYTRSAKTMADLGRDVESGMVSINHHGLALPELPFGGVKDSGYGSEGGAEALEAYLNPKLVTQMT
jgi:succinate-semialdehyde dehydrogenase / glutarate-semialdehyde dehydrogenase